MNATHQTLLKLINKVEAKVRQINYSGITQLYTNLEIFSNDTELLRNKTNKNIKFLNLIEKRNTIIQKNVTSLNYKIANISKFNQENLELNQTITELDDKYRNLKDIFYQKSNASKKCLAAKDQQLNLTNTVNNIKNIDKKLAKNFTQIKDKVDDLNNNIEKTFQKAVKIKNDLDEIHVPEQVIESYLNDTEIKLNHSVLVLKKNAQLLEDILSGKCA